MLMISGCCIQIVLIFGKLARIQNYRDSLFSVVDLVLIVDQLGILIGFTTIKIQTKPISVRGGELVRPYCLLIDKFRIAFTYLFGED